MYEHLDILGIKSLIAGVFCQDVFPFYLISHLNPMQWFLFESHAVVSVRFTMQWFLKTLHCPFIYYIPVSVCLYFARHSILKYPATLPLLWDQHTAESEADFFPDILCSFSLSCSMIRLLWTLVVDFPIYPGNEVCKLL